MTIPAFGLGTFRLKDDVVIASVKTALELGYRAVDTAQIYDNEAAVGQAITESGVPRSELYITTKIWIENLSKDKLIPSLPFTKRFNQRHQEMQHYRRCRIDTQ